MISSTWAVVAFSVLLNLLIDWDVFEEDFARFYIARVCLVEIFRDPTP